MHEGSLWITALCIRAIPVGQMSGALALLCVGRPRKHRLHPCMAFSLPKEETKSLVHTMSKKC